ncbi:MULTISPECIES: fumarylacetoacetate hydrolase family protein [unclassified Mesorhizobium]|uniref:fumarylacetoacetate hydrolase family protein n=1 Tax=unclassified Mesorhizobium TaxID=325217 RepID=UPI00086D49FA|nr:MULTISPECIES: fumarylacetoacetate hydrolase family protein [unclassified Mesorhizobium]MBN9255172.1 fumarylacetoacetate hydrolase family protein [Mesorhizobium sp.]MBN9273625.1 fumarylacetoacetate hydrolase family protein [Mesorhizobium sp.]ODT20443.1 MAG: fumarylacetoacetate hydrolase [Mesorhizobium sp. SCN 65-12]OJX82742.1 MAG: fumarylacetoacetate hydrolase [Mesorhizobium sp. 65-26]
MTSFIIPPPATPSVAVANSTERFPVRRIFCVGRNYAAHARELGNDERDPPFFFTKPGDAVVDSDSTIPYPALTKNLHHEIELVVAIGKAGFRIPRERAPDHVWGYGVGIDLTRRDLQDEAKKAARPWDWSKAFDRSAPCGPIVPVSISGHPQKGRIWLAVNGTVKQDGDLAELIWPVADVVSICSDAVELQPGDLIFTGTPAGVGALAAGDVISGGVDGVGEIRLTLGPSS